ncbi:S8 family serine peptidase [Geitlerinema splendidum]|nr:S8 family serine peptidase [Geitlerinema splendidum]
MALLNGTIGDNLIAGTSQADTIAALEGNDTVAGLEGSDLLYGNQGNDLLYGNQGQDTLYGGKGNDTLYGGKDNDLLLGNVGEDTLVGNQGNDTLYGGKGNDVLRGGQGNDLVFGDQGNDVLYGDLGNDTLRGGEGRDVFVLGTESDVFADFTPGEDLIGLSSGLSFSNLSIAQGTGTNANNTIITNTQTGAILAILQGVNSSSLGASDFTTNLSPITANAPTPSPTTPPVNPPVRPPLQSPSPTPVEDPGETLLTAANIGSLTSSRVFTNFVGDSDPTDIYRFSLPTASRLNAVLNGLSADADLYLIRDFNNNNEIDDNDVINFSLEEGTTPETIEQALAAGTYFLVVEQYEGDTNYNLNLSATPVPAPVDTAGETLATARNVGNLTATPQVINEFVGEVDPTDIFKVTLTQASNTIKIDLTNLSADADLYLGRDRNNDGDIELSEILAQSENPGTAAESIEVSGLVAGDYYIFVEQFEGDTNYDLSLSSTATPTPVPTPTPTPISYSTDFGYGLVNAAAAVARVLNQAPFADVPDPTSTTPNNNLGDLNLINAPEVWAKGYTGQGIVVAVIDTGVDYRHPELADNMWRNTREIPGDGIDNDGNGYIDDVFGFDFVGNDSDPQEDPSDKQGFGHGTHVAGTIAGRNNGITTDANGNSFQMTGVAYNAQIMALRALGPQSASATTRFPDPVASAIDYAVANGAKVINMSLGVPGPDSTQDSITNDETKAALQRARAAGVAVVAIASGNNRDSYAAGQVTRPAVPSRYSQDDLAMSVGAVDRDRKLASFSNPAGLPQLDFIVAPGVQVLSAWPGNIYNSIDGTSMATPHVAGVMALMLDAAARNNVTLTPSQLENILTQTSTQNVIV